MPLLHVSYFAVLMTFDAYLTKMYPADLRGMMNSCQGICNLIGVVLYLGICGSLNEVATKYPFAGVAAIDVIVAITAVILGKVGLLEEPEIQQEMVDNLSDSEITV